MMLHLMAGLELTKVSANMAGHIAQPTVPLAQLRRDMLRTRKCMPASAASSSARSSTESLPPWAFGFQMNERYLNWDAAAHTQLLKLACAEKLEIDTATVEAKLEELLALVPDLAEKLGRMKADMLMRLLSDTERLAERLSQLRGLLPATNVSMLVSRLPAIVLEHEAEELAARLNILKGKFGHRTDVEFLVAREPNLLRYAASEQAVDTLLERVGRMLPVGTAEDFVISNPGLVLDMDASNLPSAIDGDLTQDV